jgi:hypothetical protein
VDPGGAGGAQRVLRPLMEDRVLRDERPVEIGREERDVVGEAGREDQPEVAWWT